MIPAQAILRVVTVAPQGVVDGDTLRVIDPGREGWGAQLARLRPSETGELRLRLAAVDAPESLYPGGPQGLQHQPQGATRRAEAALAGLLAGCPDARLLIAVRGVDRYGRALALAWPPCEAPAVAGDPLRGWLPAAAPPWHTSLNARLLEAGACYPDFHDDLPDPALQVFRHGVQTARTAGRGVWAEDCTARGVTLDDWAALREGCLILPRLFRRIADFHRLRTTGDAQWSLREFLEQSAGSVRRRDTGRVTPFAEAVTIRDGRVSILDDVENFLYQSCFTNTKLT